MYNPNINYRVIKQNGRVVIYQRPFMTLNWSIFGIYPNLSIACGAIEAGL